MPEEGIAVFFHACQHKSVENILDRGERPCFHALALGHSSIIVLGLWKIFLSKLGADDHQIEALRNRDPVPAIGLGIAQHPVAHKEHRLRDHQVFVLRENVRHTFQYGRAVSGAHLQGTVTNGVSFESIVFSNTLPRKKQTKR